MDTLEFNIFNYLLVLVVLVGLSCAYIRRIVQVMLTEIRDDVSDSRQSTQPCQQPNVHCSPVPVVCDIEPHENCSSNTVLAQDLTPCTKSNINLQINGDQKILFIPQVRYEIGACVLNLVNLMMCLAVKLTTTYEAQDARCQYLKTTTIVKYTIHFIFLSAITVLFRFALKVHIGGGRMSKWQTMSTFSAIIAPTTALAVLYTAISILYPGRRTVTASDSLWVMCFTRWQASSESLEKGYQWWSLLWGIPLLVGHLASVLVKRYLHSILKENTQGEWNIAAEREPGRLDLLAIPNCMPISTKTNHKDIILQHLEVPSSEQISGVTTKFLIIDLWIIIDLALFSFMWVLIYVLLEWMLSAVDLGYHAITAYIVLLTISSVWQLVHIMIESHLAGRRK